jgi:hypothetical protein
MPDRQARANGFGYFLKQDTILKLTLWILRVVHLASFVSNTEEQNYKPVIADILFHPLTTEAKIVPMTYQQASLVLPFLLLVVSTGKSKTKFKGWCHCHWGALPHWEMKLHHGNVVWFNFIIVNITVGMHDSSATLIHFAMAGQLS